MYPPHMQNSIKNVESTRAARLNFAPQRMSADEKESLLKKFHPDYQDDAFDLIKVGKNAGQKAPVELCEALHSKSLVSAFEINLNDPSFDTDVLIIGGGGAGASAAIEAHHEGASVMIATKLRMGDANSMMAEGGIQAADKENDSPQQHYLDAYGGGHFAAKPELLKRLVMDGPGAIDWLSSFGVLFDKETDGTMITTHGGGTSRKRMHACADYTGAEIMRVLRDEVKCLKIPILEYTAAIELIMDEDGNTAGAVLMNMLTGERLIARAKSVILATGGAGRMHYRGFPTSNHYGATADGLVLAYRAGANLLYQETLQYHPTGVAYPSQLFGALVTEKVRALGAMLVNIEGTAFVHPLETRDVACAAVMRECSERGKGIKTSEGEGVWLDSPLIDIIRGKGHTEKSLPGMHRMFMNYGIDMREVPILVYPTLHYQNGGIEIEAEGNTKAVQNLFVAGEAVGGIHGKNRLMGNSLLDIIVFGRLAGKNAAKMSKNMEHGTPTLSHVKKYEQELISAGLDTGKTSPVLLPKYARKM